MVHMVDGAAHDHTLKRASRRSCVLDRLQMQQSVYLHQQEARGRKADTIAGFDVLVLHI